MQAIILSLNQFAVFNLQDVSPREIILKVGGINLMHSEGCRSGVAVEERIIVEEKFDIGNLRGR